MRIKLPPFRQTIDAVIIQAKVILRPWPVNRSRGCYQILMALYNLKKLSTIVIDAANKGWSSLTPLITLAETQTVSDSRILTVCLTGKLFNRVESGRCGAFLIVKGHFMSSPFCALLVFDFTSIWAILEPQSSNRLRNRLFDREICSMELSWVGAECSSLFLINNHFVCDVAYLCC